MREKDYYGRDVERGNDGSILVKQPRRYSFGTVDGPQPDYINWSYASLFVCIFWGVFAFMASNKVQKYNNLKAYNEAAHYSRIGRIT